MDKSNINNTGRFAPPAGCKPVGTGTSIALTAVSAILAGAFPSDYGGFIFLIVAAGLFAYVLTASFSFLYVGAGAVVSVLVSLLCGVKFPLALISLIYIPVAFIISEAARRRMNLSGTVAAMTVTLAVLLGAAAGICYLTAGDALIEAVRNTVNGYFDMLEAQMERLNAASDKVIYTENYMDSMKNAVLMLSPSVAVLVCMGVSYVTAKIFRLATIVGDSNEIFRGGSWSVSASLAGSVLFLASYILSMFAYNSELLYYSAANIMYIVLPAQAIVGFRLMFGRGGVFRADSLRGAKWVTIIVCAYFAIVNPIMLLMLAAMFTVFRNIRLWWTVHKKNKEDQ